MRKENCFGKRFAGVALIFLCLLFSLSACGEKDEQKDFQTSSISWESLDFSRSAELEYAKNFSIDYTEDRYTLLNVAEEGTFLIVPEGKEIPSDIPSDMAVLQRPLENIYLAATATMDCFCALDGLDAIRFSGSKAEDWYIERARQAMEQGEIQYAGKYSMPDYEQIVDQGCSLAIESTMIHHTPEVKENLEKFGIPVLVDRSSYEPHPLGRVEWVRVYGALLGKDAEADALMAAQSAKIKDILQVENTGKRVAFFYVSNKGYVNVRKSKDYISKMLEMAGGKYLFSDLGKDETALSTVNLQMEEFYAAARNADILIYNSTIGEELDSLDTFLAKCPLLTDSKAVKNGEVWCTNRNMFQETMCLGDMIQEFQSVILNEKDASLQYLYRLE